jgi:hypothetical protein
MDDRPRAARRGTELGLQTVSRQAEGRQPHHAGAGPLRAAARETRPRSQIKPEVRSSARNATAESDQIPSRTSPVLVRVRPEDPLVCTGVADRPRRLHVAQRHCSTPVGERARHIVQRQFAALRDCRHAPKRAPAERSSVGRCVRVRRRRGKGPLHDGHGSDTTWRPVVSQGNQQY